jgi:predicted HicB family RNase H-like nuclease
MNMDLKTLRIQAITHKRLKIFCAKQGFKINEWVDSIINKTINSLTTKKYVKKTNT